MNESKREDSKAMMRAALEKKNQILTRVNTRKDKESSRKIKSSGAKTPKVFRRKSG